MPGNQIVINNAIKYYVGDSKIEELLTWLDSNGIKQGSEANAESEDTKPHGLPTTLEKDLEV
jgi:hypothetical protein